MRTTVKLKLIKLIFYKLKLQFLSSLCQEILLMISFSDLDSLWILLVIYSILHAIMAGIFIHLFPSSGLSHIIQLITWSIVNISHIILLISCFTQLVNHFILLIKLIKCDIARFPKPNINFNLNIHLSFVRIP